MYFIIFVIKSALLTSKIFILLYFFISRDNFDGKIVLKLEYEAYEPMAVKQLNILCSGKDVFIFYLFLCYLNKASHV